MESERALRAAAAACFSSRVCFDVFRFIGERLVAGIPLSMSIVILASGLRLLLLAFFWALLDDMVLRFVLPTFAVSTLPIHHEHESMNIVMSNFALYQQQTLAQYQSN